MGFQLPFQKRYHQSNKALQNHPSSILQRDAFQGKRSSLVCLGINYNAGKFYKIGDRVKYSGIGGNPEDDFDVDDFIRRMTIATGLNVQERLNLFEFLNLFLFEFGSTKVNQI